MIKIIFKSLYHISTASLSRTLSPFVILSCFFTKFFLYFWYLSIIVLIILLSIQNWCWYIACMSVCASLLVLFLLWKGKNNKREWLRKLKCEDINTHLDLGVKSTLHRFVIIYFCWIAFGCLVRWLLNGRWWGTVFSFDRFNKLGKINRNAAIFPCVKKNTAEMCSGDLQTHLCNVQVN